jgi:hypothetical protein
VKKKMHDALGESYYRCLSLLEKATRLWLAGRDKDEPAPELRLPTVQGMWISVCIDQITIAKNAAARELVDLLCMVCVETMGPNRQPTVEMLRAVLQNVGLPYERAPLEAFGRFTPLSPARRGGGQPS